MAKFGDLVRMKNDTQRKKAIRERIGQLLYNVLREQFGDDTVLLKKKITVFNSDIPGGSIICDVGDVPDKDGFPVGAIVEVSIKVKSWNTVATTRGVRHAVTMDDIVLALDDLDESENG